MIKTLKQVGQTLIVALVMLVVLTLLVVSAIRAGNTNLRIVGNMQLQEEVSAAARQATEQVMGANFTANPAPQAIDVDINLDGSADYTASVNPICTGSIAITNADLDPGLEADLPCVSSGAAQQTGLMVSGVAATATLGGQSWCYLQQWELQAAVNDSNTGATATTVQGVALRVPAGTSCP
jgi:Tfp pilus assembly protein PilX